MKKLFILLLLLPTIIFANEGKGLEIAKKMRESQSGFVAESALMQMILIDSKDVEIIREMKGYIKEVKGDGDKSLNEFLTPKDIKGTKMLTWSHKGEDDDQWLYLPSLKRVKRISSRNKSSSYMGSEFSYEDLGSQEVEKYTFKYIKNEKLNNIDTFVVERYPKEKSGYTKQVMWIDSKKYIPLKIDYYDRKKELLKTATFSKYNSVKINSKLVQKADEILMINHQTRKKSKFLIKDRKMGLDLSDSKFTKRALK